MILIVSPLGEVSQVIAEVRPARVLTLLSPEQDAPTIPADVRHLVLRFHDVAVPTPGLVAPNEAMIKALLDFGAAWCEPHPMLVHCSMGISRSPAAAVVLACALAPERDEYEIVQMLRRTSPSAAANPLMIDLADRYLGRKGRLVAAVRSIGRGVEAACGNAFQFPIG